MPAAKSPSPSVRFRFLFAAGILGGLLVAAAAGRAVAPASSQPATARSAPPAMADFFASRWTYQPSWSPDGRFIAYLQDDWRSQQIFVAGADGGPARQLSQAVRFIGNPRGSSFGQAPVWAPDSSALLYGQDGDLKLVAKGPGGKWELYDIAKDRVEQHDLAAAQSDKARELAEKWEAWAKRANALPWIWTPDYQRDGGDKPQPKKKKKAQE